MRPSKVHLYDPSLHELLYRDGRRERVPDLIVELTGAEDELEVVALWAKGTCRVPLQDEIAMIAAS